MSEQAQIKALAAASAGTDAVGALIEYARQGGPIDNARNYDMVYPLADALRLALEAVNDRADALSTADNDLLNAVQKGIEA
ncbi:hypothetical protein [Sphingomonas sp. SRS2]|uniref:hypothetical protein n=1 Tax=Sphingomonas sp. SRS2 TaxID=133190 RepID=UPI0006184D5E|nr:hypothetical protein [Sphingomonas sp. SRS2]KKC24685.1 hypothetical protein WP12_17785 [Sphingomonas sp. SRS2]